MQLRTLAPSTMLVLVPAAALALLACDSKPRPLLETPAPTAPPVDVAAPDSQDPVDPTTPKKGAPTASDASTFIADINTRFLNLKARAETAEYIKSTYITPDTERNAASAQSDVMAYLSEAIPKAATFRDLELPKDDRRTLELLRTSPTLPAPADKALRDELAALSAKLEGHYGSAKVCVKAPGDKDGRPRPRLLLLDDVFLERQQDRDEVRLLPFRDLELL